MFNVNSSYKTTIQKQIYCIRYYIKKISNKYHACHGITSWLIAVVEKVFILCFKDILLHKTMFGIYILDFTPIDYSYYFLDQIYIKIVLSNVMYCYA